MQHSPLGGSTLKRWSNCPGSVKLSEDLANYSSQYADEGTKAHEIAAFFLINRFWPPLPGNYDLKPIELYTETILSDWWQAKGNPKSTLLIEQKFDLSQIYPNLFGTADAVIYSAENKLLRVYDYKHGQGTRVDVFEDGKPNLQLMYYALGAALTGQFPLEKIEIVIIQPRCDHPDGPIRRHEITALELLDFSEDLKQYAIATSRPNAPLKAGTHCKFCPAAAICPEIHRNAIQLAQKHFSQVYDPDQLSHVLKWLPILSNWISSVREFAYREAEHGRAPPGWKLVPKRATRKWRNEEEAIKMFKGFPEVMETTLKSPAQVEKVFHDKEFIKNLVVSISSGNTLVEASDKRSSIKEFEAV